MTDTLLDGLLRRDGDRLAVRFERRYATPAADLWDALTAPDRVARWLAALTVDARVGGAYRLDFAPDQTTRGTVLVCEPPRHLRVTWEFTGEPESVVDVVLTPDGDDAVALVLDHTRLPVDQGAGYGAGWHAHLDGLHALTGGPETAWDSVFGEVLPRYRAQAESVG